MCNGTPYLLSVYGKLYESLWESVAVLAIDLNVFNFQRIKFRQERFKWLFCNLIHQLFICGNTGCFKGRIIGWLFNANHRMRLCIEILSQVQIRKHTIKMFFL